MVSSGVCGVRCWLFVVRRLCFCVAGCSLALAARCWLLVVCGLSVYVFVVCLFSCWSLCVACCLLLVGLLFVDSVFVVRCLLFFYCSSLFDVRCSLLVVRCMLFVACRLLIVVRCLCVVVCVLLFVVRCSMCGGRVSLSVDCCVLFVAGC